MIAVVTDSASMLPAAWRVDGVHVAPMTVVVDGTPYREEVELDGPTFYRDLAAGASVSTSAPSPGDLLATFRAAVTSGATEIVAIHTGSAYSAVLDASRIAARELGDGAEVRFVDSGTASFPVALCVAAALDARAAGADAGEVAVAAERTVAVVDSVFVIGAPALAVQGGRLHGPQPSATAILGLGPKGLVEHGHAVDLDDALAQMADHVRVVAATGPLRVGVGDADRPQLGDALADRLVAVPGIAELCRYAIGPSVGAHSGAGTVGAVWAPLGNG